MFKALHTAFVYTAFCIVYTAFAAVPSTQTKLLVHQGQGSVPSSTTTYPTGGKHLLEF